MDTLRIERFASRVDADLACSMLRAHGFNARVSGDDVAGIHPDIPFGIGGTAVVVPREQYEDALALLDEEFAGELADEATSPVPDDPGDGDTDTHQRSPGRTVDRRRGLRLFALVAALAIAAIFLASTGEVVGWW